MIPYARGKHEEINVLTPKQHLCSAQYSTHVRIPVNVNGQRTVAMIDSGATGNFISKYLVRSRGLPTRKKKQQYDLQMADGSKLSTGRIDEETFSLPVAIQRHHEEITFDVVGMATHHVILGMPWLKKHNPVIDWTKGVLRFEQTGNVTSIHPIHRQRTMIDERLNRRPVEACVASSSKNKDGFQQRRSDSTATKKGQRGKEVRVSEGSDAPSAIPREYGKWAHLFEEETTAKALPRYQPWDHEIELEPGKEPTFGPIYALSEKELKVLREYIDENLKKGFIRESKSPAGYPILFAPKKDGSLRLCVDYRKLNDITIKNRYPLPNIGELQDRLGQAKIFTKLDLRGAYNLIRMKEGEEWKTAFRTRYGHYEYLVMPFGLTNAPATCQALINNVIRAHLDRTAIAYLDDILIYSDDKTQHVEHVQDVLSCLSQAELRLKPEKCEFHRDSVEFLGFVVSTEGIQMSPDKIKAILEWPTPYDVKTVQGFLGFANFNRKFIEGYSKKALPLTDITKKDVGFRWGNDQQKAFDDLRKACADPPVLCTFRANEPARIETDASDLAIGACLCQMKDQKWHPCAYYSRKMSAAEQNYDIHDKELLAVVCALQNWRVYAESCSELTIFTDHKNLLNFTTTKELNRRQVRWSELLGQYKFKITYTPGKDNGRADALSRRSDHMEEKNVTERPILKKEADGSLVPHQVLATTLQISGPDTTDMIVKAYDNDAFAKTLQSQQPNAVLLRYQDKTYLPDACIEGVIRDHHDDPLQGHPGVSKTIELLGRGYAAPKLRARVEQYVRECIQCQRNKAARHAKYGQIQFAPVPESPWDDITMDFVVKLPKSKDPATQDAFDSIMVIVDKLTKYAIMVPFKESYKADQLAFVLLDRLIRDHGIPKSITSDRDKLFTSNYWRTLVAAIGTKLRMSTAYHPQTDGQTERANQTMEAYLRHYVNQKQDNWVSLLPMAQFAYNDKRSDTTKLTPFFANFGKNANSFLHPREGPNAEKALVKATELKELHSEMQRIIQQTNGKLEGQVNKRKKNGPQLKEGDKVYLLTKHLKTKRPSKKLDHVKVGPFLIKKVKGPVNYELSLPPDAKIHPVFHVSLLEPADSTTPLQETFHYETEEETEYEVETILGQQGQQYLVKWKGYDETESTWEPLKNLANCQNLLQRFHQGERTRAPRCPSPRVTPTHRKLRRNRH